MDVLSLQEDQNYERINDCEEDECERYLTNAANKTFDLSKSLTDHCNRLADLDVDDILLNLPDDHEVPHEASLQKIHPLPRPDPSFVATPDSTYKQARRMRIVGEILTTERSYCDGLWLLLDHFIDSIRRSRLVGEDVFDTMFSPALEEIYKNHCDLLQKLEIRFLNWTEASCVGDLFMDVFKFHNSALFQQYQEYMKGFSNSLLKIRKISKSNSNFLHFLKILEDDHKCNRLNLDSYLLTPVQRIPRYVLLLKQLLRYTTPSHDDWTLVSCSLQELGTFLSRLNSSIEHSINMVSIKADAKPKKRFGISLSFRMNIQPTKKLQRQLSSRQNFEPPTANFDPLTSTPIKKLDESLRPDFEQFAMDDVNLSHVSEEKQEPCNETGHKSLYTYEEYLAAGSDKVDGVGEESRRNDQNVLTSTIPSKLMSQAFGGSKTDIKSRFLTLRSSDVKGKKGPLVASHDIAIPEQSVVELNKKAIKRTVSGNSSFLKERWLKRFKPSQEGELEDLSNVSMKSKRSLKDSFKGMFKFKSFSSMPRPQISVSSLSSISDISPSKLD